MNQLIDFDFDYRQQPPICFKLFFFFHFNDIIRINKFYIRLIAVKLNLLVNKY